LEYTYDAQTHERQIKKKITLCVASLISTAGDGPTVSRRGPYRINFCDATDAERDAPSLQQFNFSAETS
jgi:hypothetical protein